jgi:hypothetical protein
MLNMDEPFIPAANIVQVLHNLRGDSTSAQIHWCICVFFYLGSMHANFLSEKVAE